ncbi:hypothetical protein M9H77_28491 [Catharanthus roseus]|uniref:Uncharacterized protein n=1 Tax=Catharanthus roseus TaxID=4058 RepID=A0ACC0AFI8_CATRO|nr:hypothetical protein M9H77_28491 [Catharanthus roseus]
MASSDNLVSMDAWGFRPTFTDPWLSEAFARDTETLTKALQKSLSGGNSDNVSSEMINPFNYKPDTSTSPIQTPTVSGGSENETVVSKRRIGATVGVNGGKISKRKSRASKRTTTTFITADPANFRQMVQQVTGIRFGGNGQLPVTTILKPEPHRLQTGCLPTLDTSAYLLDQQNLMVSTSSSLMVQPHISASIPPPPTPSMVMTDGGSAGFDFGSFCSFPTLESGILESNVM